MDLPNLSALQLVADGRPSDVGGPLDPRLNDLEKEQDRWTGDQWRTYMSNQTHNLETTIRLLTDERDEYKARAYQIEQECKAALIEAKKRVDGWEAKLNDLAIEHAALTAVASKDRAKLDKFHLNWDVMRSKYKASLYELKRLRLEMGYKDPTRKAEMQKYVSEIDEEMRRV